MKAFLQAKIFTYHNLKGVINNKNLVILKGDEYSSEGITNKLNYVRKFYRMIEGGINNGETQTKKI